MTQTPMLLPRIEDIPVEVRGGGTLRVVCPRRFETNTIGRQAVQSSGSPYERYSWWVRYRHASGVTLINYWHRTDNQDDTKWTLTRQWRVLE